MSDVLVLVPTETITIADAVASHLHALETRKRRPAKQSSLATFRAYQKRIVASVGDAPVSGFSNASMREFVAHLASESLAPKTIQETVSFLKSSIANVVDAEGEGRFPKVWRTQFHDLPEVKSQRQPTVTAQELETAIAAAFAAGHRLDAVLWVLAAGSGARIGEMRALRVGPLPETSIWTPEHASLLIRTSMWRNVEQVPKTEAANRTIELAPELNDLLKAFVAERRAKPGDFLIAKSNGKPADVTTLREHLDKYLPGKGFHSLRRFRATFLRSKQVPEDVIRFWLGHSSGSGSVTDRYSKLGLDLAVRRTEVERCGLGFTLPHQKEGPA